MTPQETKPQRPRRRWLRRIVLLLVVWFLAEQGVNFWLRRGWVGTRTINSVALARLETTFGRSVEAGYFQVSTFGRPRIEAYFVTVGEDPRFGSEPFLYADRVSAGLRWRSLLLGRIELGTIAFARPSLNLVRNDAGEWNLASWLPAPAGQSETGPPIQRPGRIYRIEVTGGRVNFKQGPDKHPFALVEMDGTVEQESPGQWRVDLESQPMNSTVALQEAGTLRVRGRIGSTAARLRPADLQVTWIEASLADVLRLTRGRDFGIRGEASLDFTLRTPAEPYAAWTASGVARMRGIHRWDLPPRATDPALNLHCDAEWKPGSARIALTRGVIEGPRSTIRALGKFSWDSAGAENDTELRLTSSGIAVTDVFEWYRAFRPGVAANIAMEGNAGLDVHLTGWPPRIQQGVIAIDGALLRAPSLRLPVRLSRVLIESERGVFVMAPVRLGSFGEAPQQILAPPAKRRGRSASRSEPPAGAWRLEGSAAPSENRFELKLAGRVERAQDVLAALAPLGWTTLAGWTVEGGAAVNLTWRGSIVPFRPAASGTIEPRGLELRPPFLVRPIVIQEARAEFVEGERRVRVTSAAAFGARWSGTLARKANAGAWEFTLSAGRLDLAEMSRWFAAPAPPGALVRFVFRARTTPDRAPPSLEARGRLTIDQLLLAPLAVQRLRANVELSGEPWVLRLADAQGDFYGGSLSGTLHAESGLPPSYKFDGQFARTNLDLLTAATPALGRRFSGIATGKLHLESSGSGREPLLDALTGSGEMEVRGAQIRGFDLVAQFQNPRAPSPARPADSVFALAAGSFTIGRRMVEFDDLNLRTPRAELAAAGKVGFDQALDVAVRQLPAHTASGKLVTVQPAPANIRIRGTLATPRVEPIVAASP